MGPRLKGVSWVRPDAMHLTLKFLGDIHARHVEDIAQAMARAAESVPKFTLATAATGVFPNPARARVLWVGLNDSGNSCARLQAELEKNLEPLGFKAESRPFKPHLTLARFKTPSRVPQEIVDIECESVTFDVTELILFQSRLRPQGAIYTKLKTASLLSSVAP